MDAYHKVNMAKKRTHSLFRQGAYWYGGISFDARRLAREPDEGLR